MKFGAQALDTTHGMAIVPTYLPGSNRPCEAAPTRRRAFDGIRCQLGYGMGFVSSARRHPRCIGFHTMVVEAVGHECAVLRDDQPASGSSPYERTQIQSKAANDEKVRRHAPSVGCLVRNPTPKPAAKGQDPSSARRHSLACAEARRAAPTRAAGLAGIRLPTSP